MSRCFWAGALALGLSASAASAIEYGYSVASNGNDHLYQINLATGVATDLGLVGNADAEGLAFRAGALLAIGGNIQPQLWNITTPPGSNIGGTGPRTGIDAGLATRPSDNVLFNIMGDLDGTSSLYSVNPATGAATLVGTDPDVFGDSLAINAGNQAFAADAVFSDGLSSVNLATGDLTPIGSFGLGNISGASGLDFNSAGVLYMLLSDGRLFTVNTGSGAATFVAQVTDGAADLTSFEGFAIGEIGVTAAAVPEPASAILLILSAAAFSRRRRQ